MGRKQKTFRRAKLYAVIDGPDFAAELAVVMADNKQKTLLIDAALLRPSLAEKLGMKKTVNDQITGRLKTQSGLRMALDYICREGGRAESLSLLTEFPVEVKENLWLLTGNDDHANYEYFDDGAYECLLEKVCKSYDMVVVNTDPFLYDSYMQMTLSKSHISYFQVPASLTRLKNVLKDMLYIQTKRKIDKDGLKIVVMDYDPKSQLSVMLLKQMLKERLACIITRSKDRESAEMDIYSSYALKMSKVNQKEYRDILEKLGTISGNGFFESFMKRYREKRERRDKDAGLTTIGRGQGDSVEERRLG